MIDIRIGDSMKLIKELPDKSVDCCVTSPPYWNLRDYKTEPIIFDGLPDCEHEWKEPLKISKSGGTNGGISLTQDDSIHIHQESNFCSLCGAWQGQLGLEPTPELFIKHLLDFFDDVKLKLKDEGNCFVNLGDSYGTQSGSMAAGKLGGDSHKFDYELLDKPMLKGNSSVVKHKCLCLIPERFAIGMVDRGWILRNIIVWYKRNHMPESVTDRWTKAHEVVYFFTKQQKNYFNLDAIREPHKEQSIGRYQRSLELGANAVKGKFLQREKQNTGVPRHAPKWFTEGANTGANNKEPYMQNNPHTARLYEGKFDGNADIESFGSPRARTQRKPYAVQEREKPFIEYRENLPSLGELKEFLNLHRVSKNLTMDEVEQMFGNMAAHHWFGGECYPSPKDWIKLKQILGFNGNYDEVMTQEFIKSSDKIDNPNGKNPGDVWDITTQPYSEAHFATFPLELVRQPILAGCPLNGLVLDPFAGSGTVGEFCRHNDRNAILFELNPEYKKLAVNRSMINIPELSNWCL